MLNVDCRLLIHERRGILGVYLIQSRQLSSQQPMGLLLVGTSPFRFCLRPRDPHLANLGITAGRGTGSCAKPPSHLWPTQSLSRQVTERCFLNDWSSRYSLNQFLTRRLPVPVRVIVIKPSKPRPHLFS